MNHPGARHFTWLVALSLVLASARVLSAQADDDGNEKPAAAPRSDLNAVAGWKLAPPAVAKPQQTFAKRVGRRSI